MATISKVWSAPATIYQTNAFGGVDPDINGTQRYTTDIDLETNGYEGIHLTIDADFPVSPTDDLNWYLYGSLDGTNYDDTAITSGQIDKDTDPNQISLVIKDVAHCRIGMVRSGATDSIDVEVKYQAWRWQTA